MLNEVDAFLTVDEACELLKIGHNAIYRLLNTGELKAFRNGQRWKQCQKDSKAYIPFVLLFPELDRCRLLTPRKEVLKNQKNIVS